MKALLNSNIFRAFIIIGLCVLVIFMWEKRRLDKEIESMDNLRDSLNSVIKDKENLLLLQKQESEFLFYVVDSLKNLVIVTSEINHNLIDSKYEKKFNDISIASNDEQLVIFTEYLSKEDSLFGRYLDSNNATPIKEN